jgi:NADH-quinone oxidoreductase subunit G
MPRPNPRMITFTIDGRETQAPENAMLVDAAKHGDVEIPVFCYEPKLGGPVGACRMCLVEVEGIPKLQPGCATPVKDGMVVNTQSERVKEAQRGVVEFLLVNHPLDCPVCDKGGECPLQDISFGWGGGISRFVEPKRHFVKPVELSSKIAIDRERCILCYRCVRFSQDVSEDHQLVLLERGAHSYVATFDGHPYEAPFSGNIVELCPVGALTALPYRFKARPWDIEDAGTVCTLCPSQCNVTLTVRDEKVLRALARENPEVDDGWLCNRGRFVRDEIHGPQRVTEPMIRDGGVLRATTWERALAEAAGALTRAGEHSAALAGGGATNEEGFLLARTLREGLGSPHIDSRPAGKLSLDLHRALAEPSLQARVSDLEHAHAVLVLDCDPVRDMPIIDLRIRKGVRHKGVALAIASQEPGTLDRRAAEVVRFAPGMGGVFAQALASALGDGAEVDRLAQQAGSDPQAIRSLATLLSGADSQDAGQEPREVAIVWGEGLAAGEHGAAGVQALIEIAQRLSIADVPGAGLLEVPTEANGRGLREAGVLPNAGPGLQPSPEHGMDARSIARALAGGDLTAVHLLQCDPLVEGYDRELWAPALERATTVIAHASTLTEGIAAHANVVFPAESHAEKEGTVVHPDGRIQRLRPVVGRQGQTRAGWLVLADLAAQLGLDLGVNSGPEATEQLAQAVPFYAGLTLEEIGPKGVRWQDRDAASGLHAERVAG